MARSVDALFECFERDDGDLTLDIIVDFGFHDLDARESLFYFGLLKDWSVLLAREEEHRRNEVDEQGVREWVKTTMLQSAHELCLVDDMTACALRTLNAGFQWPRWLAAERMDVLLKVEWAQFRHGNEPAEIAEVGEGNVVEVAEVAEGNEVGEPVEVGEPNDVVPMQED